MTIVPLDEWELSYLCPACGNLYFDYTLGSYTVFRFFRFSDGSCIPEFGAPPWVTKCPRCKHYFAKEYLFPLPKAVRPCDVPEDIKSRPWRGDGEHYGHIDWDCTCGEHGITLWENVVNEGLYFPATAYKWDRKEYTIRAHKELWYCYNGCRDEISDEVYEDHCRTLIGMLDERHSDARLTLAELYRNIGEFDKSRALLDAEEFDEKEALLAECIRDELKKRNTRTVRIEDHLRLHI